MDLKIFPIGIQPKMILNIVGCPKMLSILHIHRDMVRATGLGEVPLLAKHLLATTSTNITMMAVVSHNKKAVTAVIVGHSIFTPFHIQVNQQREKII